jgi:ribosomal-protein-alanine N-acetyltransferase
VKLIPATVAETAAMAAAHALAFDKSWQADEFEDLLEGEGIFGFLARDGAGPLGLIICRIAADEMEVLTVGVPPAARRRGVALSLMNAALDIAGQRSAIAAFLEVDVANGPAIALYERLGFGRAGLRRAYYDRGAAGRADAFVMRLDLRAPPA